MWSGTAGARSLESPIDRIDTLEQENGELRLEVDALEAGWRSGEGMVERPGGTAFEGGPAGYVRMDPGSGCATGDPTSDCNRKQRLIPEPRRDGTLFPDRLHLPCADSTGSQIPHGGCHGRDGRQAGARLRRGAAGFAIVN